MLFAGAEVGEAEVGGEAGVGGEADGGFCAPATIGNMTAMESVRERLIAATFFRFDADCSPR